MEKEREIERGEEREIKTDEIPVLFYGRSARPSCELPLRPGLFRSSERSADKRSRAGCPAIQAIATTVPRCARSSYTCGITVEILSGASRSLPRCSTRGTAVARHYRHRCHNLRLLRCDHCRDRDRRGPRHRIANALARR